MLVRSSTEKVISVGETVVFECLSEQMSRGPSTAQLRVDWLKDGAPVTAARRHYLIADSQVLVLIDSRLSDAGLYSCDVSNAVGSRRAEYSLRVIDSALTSSRDSAADADSGLVSARVGLVVIAAVCGVVLTSLAWVVIIYWMQRRHDVTDTTSSTSTDETIIAVASASASAVPADVSTLNSLQHCVRLPPGTSLTAAIRLNVNVKQSHLSPPLPL